MIDFFSLFLSFPEGYSWEGRGDVLCFLFPSLNVFA